MSFRLVRRRELIAGLCGAVVWPVVVRGQQPMPVVGFFRGTSSGSSADLVNALRQGLKEAGFVEGQNLAVEYLWADNRLDRLPQMAADLVRRPCAVIIAGGNAPALAARAATSTIPIVFASGDDSMALGLVPSLSRPSGNVTGVTFYSGALAAKQLELLREVTPKALVIGILVNASSPAAAAQIKDAQAATRALGQQLYVMNVGSEGDFATAFANLAQSHVDALLSTGDALFTGHRDQLVALAARFAGSLQPT